MEEIKVKKTGLFLGLAVAFGMVVSLAAKPISKANATSIKDEYNNLPEAGEVSADSYFTNAWYQDVGARRISERGVVAVSQADWGRRGNFLKKYNVKDFSIKLHLDGVMNGSCMLLTFAKTNGGYVSEDGKVISFDIIKAVSENTLFRVTASNTVHNTSVAGFEDGTNWEDDANFTGVTVRANDQVITISTKYVNATRTDITVNGVAYTVDSGDFYKNITDSDSLYLTLGVFNNAGQQQYYIIESVGDADDEVYYSSTGTFGLVRDGLNALKTADYSSADLTVQHSNEFNALPYSDLYSYDQAYLRTLYNEAKAVIDEAVTLYGNEVKVNLYELAVADLETAAETLSTAALIRAALDKATYAASLLENITESELNSTLLGRLNTAKAKYNTAYAAVLAAINPIYESAIAAYENKVDHLAIALNIQEAYQLKAQIPSEFNTYLSESEYDAYQERIVAADAKLNTNTTLGGNVWVQGQNAKVVSQSDGSLGFYSFGQSMGMSPAESDGIYLKEKISATDFEMVINVDDLGDANGSWFTFGILEKPEMWIFADDDSVQENKGVFFLINRMDSMTLRVQAFLCSLRSNRFYDSPLNQTIQAPVGQDITISFRVETEIIAGVSMELFKMSFNDATFNQETVTAKKMKTVLPDGDCLGNLMFASGGLPSSKGAAITIKTINGKAANSTDGFAKGQSTRPSSTDTQKAIKQGTSSDLTYNLDTKGLDIQSVKVEGTALDAVNYSYANNQFTLKGSYLATLEIGVYNIEVITAGGNLVWTLTVQANNNPTPSGEEGQGEQTPEEPAKKKGCGSSIVAASAMISLTALLGFGLLSIKRKK